ncbi:MAG: FecR protein, partial [Candidatus Shapirobacteria bacterium GW2011_GWE1_38_10]
MKTWQKTVSFVAGFALLLNSFVAPFSVLAQEIIPEPTPVATTEPATTPVATIESSTTPEPTVTPVASPIDVATITPEPTP